MRTIGRKKRIWSKNGMNPWAEPFERNFIWTFWASSDVHQKLFSNICVDMDSIPWEKAWLTVREKPLTLWKKQSTWISCHADGWKEHRAARWMKRMKRIFDHPFLLREHATVFYWVFNPLSDLDMTEISFWDKSWACSYDWLQTIIS